jgi:hypothetical protein
MIISTLTAAGILAGLVNFFYLYLQIPFERKPPASSLTGEDEWEFPRRTYWLALAGYFVIGLAGAYLTPLIHAIVTLKGLDGLTPKISPSELWILFGYGIVFGYSANRLLSGISTSILARIEAMLSKLPAGGKPGVTGKGEGFTAESLGQTKSDLVEPERARLTYNQIKDLVSQNNNSPFSNELIIALCWAESSFDPLARATGSTSKGLMMVNDEAIVTVNRNTPPGIRFNPNDMLIADKAIACGTWYLKFIFTRPDWHSEGDKRKTLRAYRGVTDFIYADKIIACESCLQASVVVNPQMCLDQIHP